MVLCAFFFLLFFSLVLFFFFFFSYGLSSQARSLTLKQHANSQTNRQTATQTDGRTDRQKVYKALGEKKIRCAV